MRCSRCGVDKWTLLVLLQVLLVSDDAHLVAELNATYEAGATAAAGLARGVSSSSSAAAVAAQREQQMQALLAELGFALELKAGLLQAYDDSRNAAADAATAPLTSSNSTHSSGGGVGSSDSSSSATHCFAGRQLQHYSSKEVALLVRSARRLVAAAVRAGCPATAAALMPLAGIGVRGPEHLLAAVAAEGCSSLSPEWADAGVLHLAVASQSPHMVSLCPCTALHPVRADQGGVTTTEPLLKMHRRIVEPVHVLVGRPMLTHSQAASPHQLLATVA